MRPDVEQHRPNPERLSREAAARERAPGDAAPITVSDPTSDFMVDVLKSLDAPAH
jgi:hypothetical protein